MNKAKTTAIGAILATILGGSVYVGAEIGNSKCDYVIANQQEEICLSESQAIAIIENFTAPKVGFDGVVFDGEAPIIIPKEK